MKPFLSHFAITALFATLCGAPAMADNQGTDSLMHWRAEANVSVSSGDYAPFWLSNGRQGLSSVKHNSGYLRAGFFREAQTDRRFSWSAGVDVAAAFHNTSGFVIQQLYGGVRYRCLDLTVGAKEQHSKMVDAELSSGDLLMSENARPIPQARIAIENYRHIPYMKKRLAFRGYFSMGMFTDQDWQTSFTRGTDNQHAKGVLFHSKGIFLRLGNTEEFPLTIEGGLEMASQWGGTIYLRDGVVVKPGHGFKDAFKAVIPGHSNSEDPSLTPDALNVEGNHNGVWDIAANWAPKNADWSARVYYQHYFEDHSMVFLEYLWRDMLLGVEFNLPKNRFLDKFLYEYLITKDQSGPVYHDATPTIPEQVSGCDNYYNNYLYAGWQHWGMAIGNPLLLSPIYNSDRSLFFMHNRVKAHHFGLAGQPTAELRWRFLFSYTRSWGTYQFPTAEVMNNYNALVELAYHPARLRGWGAKLSLAIDGGDMIGHNRGAMLSVVREGWISKKK